MLKTILAADLRSAARKSGFLALLALASLTVAACDDDTNEPEVGNLDVTVTVTGDGADADGFDVTVGTASIGPVAATGGTVSASALATGNTQVTLTGVDANCTVDSATKTATITDGDTTDVTFEVTCTAPAV